MPLFEGLGGIGIMNEKHTTVVFDFGTAYTKVGFAGETGPRAILRSEVLCRNISTKVPVFQYSSEKELQHHLVDFIHKLYFKHLLVNPKDRRVVVLENLLCPSMIRNTIANVLFRHFEVCSILFAPCHLAALMTLGVSTGMVLDVGYQEATLIPTYEGISLLNCWQALPLASKAVSSSLCELLLDRAMCLQDDGSEHRLSAVMDALPERTLEDIIVRTCFVSTLERSARLQANKHDRAVEPPAPPPSVIFPLGGDRRLTIPGTARELAAEILFEQDEDHTSISTLILDALLKCPIDTRRELAANLVLIGGTATYPGFKQRLLSEVRTLAVTSPKYKDKMNIPAFKVHQPPAKDNYVAWLGGAILGGTDAVVLRSLSRDQYLDSGVVPEWCNLAYNTGEDKEEKTV